jgi:hypothetical protein
MLGKVFRISVKLGFWCVVIYGVKRLAPRPAFLSPERLSPRLEQLNDAVRDAVKIDVMHVSRSLADKVASGLDSTKNYVHSYL